MDVVRDNANVGSRDTTLHNIGTLLDRIRNEFFPTKDPFDASTGCQTSGTVSGLRLGVKVVDGVHYQPVDTHLFHEAMGKLENIAFLDSKNLRDFTFTDLGCGKGRALILSADYGFKRIIGIEYSPKLVKIASMNLSHVRVSAEVFCADAPVFPLPREPLVVFLYTRSEHRGWRD